MRGAESRSAGFDRVMVRGSGSDDGRAKGGCGGVATVVDIIVACVSVPSRHLGGAVNFFSTLVIHFSSSHGFLVIFLVQFIFFDTS